MNSYEFEKICKNAIIKIVKERFNEELTIEEIQLVWFSKTLQNYKCTGCDKNVRDNKRYYELTYNGDKKQLYIDIYIKELNVVVNEQDFDKEAKRLCIGIDISYDDYIPKEAIRKRMKELEKNKYYRYGESGTKYQLLEELLGE